ncbi:MAG: Vms1/Ankzf1 family peptidyl-tRNA hydrolase [Chloroflexi bacterium OHK40]
MDERVFLRYLDGELDPDAAAAVAAALRDDPGRRRRFAELRAIEHAYQSGQETLPEARRAALMERLRREPPTSHFDLVRRADLEALAEVHSTHGPIFSLYLDTRPERREAEPPLTRLAHLLRQTEQQVRLDERARSYRTHWAEESEHLRAWLAEHTPLEGHGLAIISCTAIGLWRAFRLPVPVRDQLVAGDQPYLRPLATLLDEFERYLVVLIDAGNARLFEVCLGTIEELDDVWGYVPPATGHFVEKTGHRHDAYLHRHAKRVAERAEALWHANHCHWLVIGGTEEALGELREHLSKPLRERLAGELHLSPQVEPGQVLERVLEIERDQEQRVEAQRVEEVVTAAHKGGAAVLGLEPTLLAIVEQRVRLLIVAEDDPRPGWVCQSCGFLGANRTEICPICGLTLTEEPDSIDVALARVLAQNGEIEVVRSRDARQLLMLHGGIGAMLRYSYGAPPPPESTH